MEMYIKYQLPYCAAAAAPAANNKSVKCMKQRERGRKDRYPTRDPLVLLIHAMWCYVTLTNQNISSLLLLPPPLNEYPTLFPLFFPPTRLDTFDESALVSKPCTQDTLHVLTLHSQQTLFCHFYRPSCLLQLPSSSGEVDQSEYG